MHLRVDQSKIDRVKKLLGAKAKQETIERALELVSDEEPILKVHRSTEAIGGFEDPPEGPPRYALGS
ncbi:hypothetical protein [Sorangium sp. So ce388]|uniref:hypothetical protein n=1 Tax=Sorangium sp. So ce388 TaxID=3133309 RepID=UPI003F5B2E12